MNNINLTELGEDVALLTGKIYAGSLESSILDLLTKDKMVLVMYHRYVTDPEILKAMLVHLTKESGVIDSPIPFD